MVKLKKFQEKQLDSIIDDTLNKKSGDIFRKPSNKKGHKKFIQILCFCLFVFFSVFIFDNDASAYSYYVDRPTGIGLQRSFINSSGNVIVGQNYTTINSYPQNILAQDPLNYLLGFRFNAIDIRNNNYKTYNTIYFDTVIYANTAALYSPAYDTFDISIRLLANNTFQQGTCEVSEVQSNYIRYHCVVASTANFKPDYLYVTFGNYNYQDGQAYYGQAVSQFLVSYIGWGFDAQDDPNTAYLQQIAQQNQTIINQNNQINNSIKEQTEKIEDINDSITDSTVEGDFNLPDIPSFGPISTIVNSIIDLPRVFLNPPACSALNVPFPILKEEHFNVPCPKVLLEPYQEAVNLIQNLLAAYIWYRVAVFIARQIKKLRDPQNDDEEYLDI